MEDGEFLQGITKQLQDCLHPDMLDIHCGGKSIGLLTLYDICIHKFNAVSEIVILLLCYFVYTSLIWSENLQKKNNLALPVMEHCSKGFQNPPN